ncbi:MAG: thiosulfate sulfurtransferase, partial [candidate division Zixibacteria bacterium]|nr:thiosulfate sulfurtransferase [candidate division Zixibacteria bacterium]
MCNPARRRYTLAAEQISTQSLTQSLNDKDTVVVDVRPIAAYNGWCLRNEPRGGHIQGAKTFPLSWIATDQRSDLLQSKGITPEKQIILYGYDPDNAQQMAAVLTAAGYQNVSVYNQFIDEWSSDTNKPMDHLPRFQQLVYPQWVNTLIEGRTPPLLDNKDVVIGHATYGYREDYEAGHIPGAVHVDTIALEDPISWNRRTPEELRKALLSLGIRHDTTVIMYGRFNHPDNDDPYPGKFAGHIAAMRCALIMKYAGVEDVRILNGGLFAWNLERLPTTAEEPDIRPKDDFGVEIPAHPEFIVDLPQAKAMLESDDSELVSVRSWEEFVGGVSGYHYVPMAGRIPGAVFGNCGSDAYHMENYRNVDHTMREYHEVRANWAENGIVPEKHIAFYCGTGWRASEAMFNAYF